MSAIAGGMDAADGDVEAGVRLPLGIGAAGSGVVAAMRAKLAGSTQRTRPATAVAGRPP